VAAVPPLRPHIGGKVDQDIANYNFAVHNSELAMVQDYYKNQPPFKGVPACVPFVPVTDDGTPRVTAEQCAYKYAEVTLPGGKTVLAIITPWVASNGPGKKYTLTER
jgi:hypothetical protein